MQTLDKNNQSGEKDKYYPLEDFESLIDSIKLATGLNEKAISRKVSSNDGYIAQARSRAKSEELPGVSPQVINKLRLAFQAILHNANPASMIANRLEKIELSLGSLVKGQEDILDQHKYTRAEIYGIARLAVFRDGADDQKKMIELWELYRTIVGGALEQDGKKGSRPFAGM